MSRNEQRLMDYLAHILEAIERIDCYTEDMSEMAFLENQMAQDAVIRNFEIIGEASHNIETHYPEFAVAHLELPLASAYHSDSKSKMTRRRAADSINNTARRSRQSQS